MDTLKKKLKKTHGQINEHHVNEHCVKLDKQL